MRVALLLLVALLSLGLQDPQNPDSTPGEPATYPEGVFCSHKGDIAYGVQTSDHPCACHRMNQSQVHDCCDHNQDSHEKNCLQYCSEKHCSCEVECPAHHE